MDLMSEIQQFAGQIDPVRLSAGLLLAITFVAVMFGFFRNGRAFSKQLPAVIFATGSWMVILIPVEDGLSKFLSALFLVLAVFGLLLHVWLRRHKNYRDDFVLSWFEGRPLFHLTLPFAICSTLLIFDLGTEGQYQHLWEYSTIMELFSFTDREMGVGELLAGSFLWNRGSLRESSFTLLYGVPTYALFQSFHVSLWTLRIVSSLSIILSFAVAYVFGRRFFNTIIGILFAVVVTLNEATLHFGRYGVSVGPTLLWLLVALYASFAFLKEGVHSRYLPALTVSALFVATLGYAPFRVVVVLMVLYVPFVAFKTWRPFGRAQLRALGIFFAGTATILIAQGVAGSLPSLLSVGSGSGQRFLEMSETFGHFTPSSRIGLAYDLIVDNLPKLANAVLPALRRSHHPFENDLSDVSLYHPPFVVFLIWGFLYSLVRWRSWRHQFFILWTTIGFVPMLFATDLQIYDSYLLVIPFSLWISMGAFEAGRIARIAMMPTRMIALVGGVLLILLTLEGAALTGYRRESSSWGSGGLHGVEFAAKYIEAIPGEVVFGTNLNNYFRANIALRFIERGRLSGEEKVSILPAQHDITLADPNLIALPGRAKAVLDFVGERPLVLYPASRYPSIGEDLPPLGFDVYEYGGLVHNLWIVYPKGERARLRGMRRLATSRSSRPLDPHKVISTGRLSLSELTPEDVLYDLTPPSYDIDVSRSDFAAFDRFRYVIQLFASTSLTYRLPDGAVGFLSAVGLATEPHECDGGSMTFSLLDDKGNELYYSGLVDHAFPKRVISIALSGTKTLTLRSNDAGDGGHCDIGFWGDPHILLKDGSASGSPRSGNRAVRRN